MLTLALLAAVALGALVGSLRLIAFALIALFFSRYPLALVLVGVGAAAIWAFYFYYYRR